MNTESQRRQYALVELAQAAGFSSVAVIDDDLGRSGSGLMARPGFQKLVAAVCTGSIGAVFCLEASRLARNGRDWHHLIDLCALVGALRRQGPAWRTSLYVAPGYCWGEGGQIVFDPDEHVVEAVRLVFRKFRELGIRQVFLWAQQLQVKLHVVQRNLAVCRIEWQAAIRSMRERMFLAGRATVPLS